MISIKQIVVEKLGPLGDCSLQLGSFNLIYGRNETGKTFLVEFILRSLFRHASSWPMRVELGQGKVIVQGLEGGPTTFSPDSKDKLEDHWDESSAGLPTNMARLMVVKGAELELSQSTAMGIDRAVLIEALSSEVLIDRILDRIPPTLREAKVVDGRIEAHKRGDINTRIKLLDDRQRLRDLSLEVENRYAQGRLQALELSQAEFQSEYAQQQQARHYAAFQLHQQRAAVEAKRNQLPQDQIEALERDIGRHLDKQAELDRLSDKWTTAKVAVEHYPWLQQAIELWERRSLDSTGSGINLLGIAAGALLVIGLGLALAGLLVNLLPLGELILTVSSIGVFLVGLSLGIAYVARIRKQTGAAVNAVERNQIQAEFKKRFGHAAGGLAGLNAQEESLRASEAEFRHLSGSVEETETEVETLASSIRNQFRSLGAENVAAGAWPKTVRQMRDWAEGQATSIHQMELRLSELGVDESDYRSEPAEIAFSAERIAQLEFEIDRLNQEIRSAQEDLENLKQEITRETGDDITAPWTDLLDSLGQRRREADNEYRTTTARILGQIGVFQVLEQLRTEEDEKIREGLKAPEIAELLSDVTGQSRSLDFEDGQLVILSDAKDYDFATLSTGAREQVLLALRMGFASRLAGGQPLFLLLDDAFQHSDWERRERLVARVVDFVHKDWQVTYLTMDDHLRDLIKNAGETAFDDEFQYYEI
ncbi:MAG: ATP-binding protein [Anaerolineales bacterium]